MTRPNHEAIAAANLQRQGFNYYYPRFSHRKLAHDKPVIRPLFPRYMFVFIEQVWRSLSGTRGISYILMGEGGPQLVSDAIIQAIKGREDKHGLFQLTAPPRFIYGEKVKSVEGPFVGLPMTFEGMSTHDRVKVLVEMLGRKVPVLLEEKLLIAA